MNTNIVRDSDEIYVTIEDITPERADALLATMVKNRKLRPVKVAEYARAMANDAFYSVTPIAIDMNGHLVDGQHRLEAVGKSGKTVRFVVEHNVPEGTIFDNGMKRSAGDSLFMSGMLPEQLARKELMAVTNAYSLCKAADHYRLITIEEKGAFIAEYGDSLLRAIDICSKGKSAPICRRSPVQAAVFAAIECGVEEERLFRFTEVVNSGFPKDNTEFAAIVLERQLRANRRNGEGMNRKISSWTEQAIADFINGKSRRNGYTKPIHPFIDECPATI